MAGYSRKPMTYVFDKVSYLRDIRWLVIETYSVHYFGFEKTRRQSRGFELQKRDLKKQDDNAHNANQLYSYLLWLEP
jgi:hypothetical protein